ncbi:fibronectin type III domain-containing protein [Chryseobacterium sp. APV1]|uniref:Fibronectin type III domain-containing protein n=1 Tax=Chryseobacterium urinae TaxID=3058400 RepID=A0ABT8U367_9FLAO|nr:fibronectin type III domain-containing protein [Chryseobacterium sp. APV1]MDO3425487.1 fibronectin type III domain-containing protein [Chryseobacterium sp. APV1]
MSHSYINKRKFNPNNRLKFKNFGIKAWAFVMLMLFGLQSISIKSQQYPVKLVPVVIPPYSMKLGDYATSTDNKLQLQVVMTDLMEPQHQTGIKFTLEAGLNAVPFAQSNEFVVGMNPFLLYPGSNVTLTNVDLRALFELQNLGGINAVQYAQPLSDGVYQFCFQAYDYYTKNNLSSKTCATVFLTQYDPPMLNLPQNAEKVQAMSPYAGGSGIVFQWMPRQIAPNTKYIFTLKELWDAGQSPISGFLSSPPLWQEETYAPTLYYGLDKTQLIPGKRYAWQVQAKSGNPVLGANPTEDNGVYKNNGFSEIYYFDYVENCTVPTLLMAKNVGRGRVEISWSLGGQPAGLYNVQYRKKNSNTEWMTQQSYQSPAILTGLEDLTEYEYRVGSVCGQVQSSNENAYSYSAIQYFTTNANDVDNNYQCGIMPAVDIANKNPLQTMLGVNEVFTAGDFPVTVLSAQGSNGIYTGTGFIQVPYLAQTKVKVSFNNIMLNTDKKLIEGVIETTYDPNETAVNYASAGLGETFGDQGVKDVFVNFPIGNIIYSATPPPGKITITGSDGNGGTGSTTEYPGGKDYTFTDSNGVIWTVDENGTVTKGGTVAQGGASTSTNTDGVTGSGSNATINQYTAKGIKIEWKENVNGQFAYDTAEKTKLPKDKYPSVKDSENNTVYVPYKATVNKKTELFDAKVSITDPALKDATIIFKTLSIGKAIEATEINKTDTERNYQLKLIGAFDYAEEEVIAVLMPKDSISKQKIISSFRLVHLSPKTVNVSLVPLDANSQSKLQSQGDKLNQIYKKIGVTFNVTKDPVLDISSIVSGDTINSEDADLMSTYSPQQQQINALYKGTDARYVLFVTDKKSSTGQKGYMRLNGQFGYVYNNAQDKTGGHELGHGVFKLEHPWKTYGTTQSATPLLMDYSTGEELSHLDWKQVNDPAFKLYAFQGQSSGELAGGFGLTPDFKLIKANTSTALHGIVSVGEGFLPGFVENTIQYQWVESQKGYYPNGDTSKTKYNSNETPKDNSAVWIIYDHNAVCGKSKFIKTSYANAVSNILSKTDKVQALADYITQYDKIEDNTKPVYSGFIACSGSGSGNGLKSVDDLYKRPSTGDGTATDESKDVVDYTGRFTAEEIQAMLGSIVSNKNSTGIKGKIFITDENTAASVLQKVQARYNQPEAKEMVIWLNVNSQTKKYDIKINVGSGLPEYAGKSAKDIELLLKQNSAWIDDFWLMKFNPLTAILDGLSELLTKAKIPEKYYNPDNTDYNPFPAKIYSYVSLKVIDDELSGLIGSPMGEKYTPSRVDFAFTCGVWNGLVGTAAAIPEGGSFLIKMITNENDARTNFATTISKIQWKDVKGMVGEQWNKYTSNPCMVSYGAGEVTFVVASCFIGAGEIKGATAVVQTMEKLDVMGQMIGKFAKFTGRFVIKPVVSKAGKFIIEPLIKLEPAISQKLRSNVSKYVAQLLNKDKIHLSLHATSEGKFIVDGIELSPEEFGEYITKKLKETGNANKNIVLLSCNDLESAKALAAVTGKKVYTTDGPMTIFENGIRRADGSEWYQINPDGTSTKIQPPVTECVNCTGNGVTMGAYFSIKKYLNNISDDLATKIENLIPWIKTLDINIGSVEEDVVGDIKAIKVVKDKAKLDRAYNIVKSEQEATNFLIKKFDAKYLETKYITDRYTGKQLELKVYLTGKDESHVLLVRKDLPDIPENLVGGGVNKEHFNFGEFSLDQFDDINLENNKLHEHIIWTD